MGADTENTKTLHPQVFKYKLLPPEGGWGYIITASLALACVTTIIPMVAFGLVFGKFLASVGDETTGTTLTNGIFNTVFNITGLAANALLQRYTYRFVAIIGALLFFLGSFTTIFVTNLTHMVISFGVIQGLGMGLLIPALFTALNCYFDKRLNLMNGVSQSLMVASSMLFPVFAKYMMDNFGFRGTAAILAALSLNAVVAAAVLQPAEWHMKKQRVAEDEEELVDKNLVLKPLVELQLEEGVVTKYISPKPRSSIISLGDRAISVTTIDQAQKERAKMGCFGSLAKSLELAMFQDWKYCNIVIGLSLGFCADVAFISIIPLILTNIQFDNSQITFLFTVYFGADLVARILLSVVSAIWQLNNRLIFSAGCFLSAIFRIAFVMNDGFTWRLSTAAALGFLRCFVQTPLPTVISDEYSSKFSTAFSLYMVVCGIVSLLNGLIMSVVKAWTRSDDMVVHYLTGMYLTCVLSWTVEFLFAKKTKSHQPPGEELGDIKK